VTATTIELSHAGNEASDLLPVLARHILETHGWSEGFWTVLDEGPVERCIAIIGHRADAPADAGWEIHPLRCLPGDHDGRTEDGEACARYDGWVYVIGSHYGSKGGPLEARRAFVARFDERELDEHVGEDHLTLQVVRNRFRLHRAINDALLSTGGLHLTPGATVRRAFIDDTLRRATKKRKRWAGNVAELDTPVNIEGAAFRPEGTALLALRFPTTADGHPILVEVAGLPAMFESPDSWPTVQRLWLLRADGLSPDGLLTGFRALSAEGDDAYSAIVGSIDATGKGSALLEDFPHGGGIHCSHWHFSLAGAEATPGPGGGPPVGEVVAELVREFPELRNVEGVSVAPGRAFYVTDEDARIALRIEPS
jgi:hypothetical protein